MCFTYKLIQIRAHEWQTENNDITWPVVQWHIFHVTLYDEVVQGNKIKRMYFLIERLCKLRFTTTKIRDYKAWRSSNGNFESQGIIVWRSLVGIVNTGTWWIRLFCWADWMAILWFDFGNPDDMRQMRLYLFEKQRKKFKPVSRQYTVETCCLSILLKVFKWIVTWFCV